MTETDNAFMQGFYGFFNWSYECLVIVMQSCGVVAGIIVLTLAAVGLAIIFQFVAERMIVQIQHARKKGCDEK